MTEATAFFAQNKPRRQMASDSSESGIANRSRSHLRRLEAESIHILREVAAEFERPVILYSVGKDSSVLLRLAQKAFHPDRVPLPLVHIDTGFKFSEMYEFRDWMAKQLGAELIVGGHDSAKASGANPYDLGTRKCCGLLKTEALLATLSRLGADAAVGGARRDEEKSRAKERFFSFRDRHGQWNPKNQRPELWRLFNTRMDPGESIRVFPLSNWTELDVWEYIDQENIPIVPLYFAKRRKVVVRGDNLIPVDTHARIFPGEIVQEITCRFRTLGCSPCTGAIFSEATTVKEIIEEISQLRTSERSTRVIDHDMDASMETKKREGYF